MFGIWLFLAIFGPALAPFPPFGNLSPIESPGSPFIPNFPSDISGLSLDRVCASPDLSDPENPSCGTFWLGTNFAGQDILSRILASYRWELSSVAVVLLLTYLIAGPLALASRPGGGLLSATLRAGLDQTTAVPPLVLYIVLIGVTGASITSFAIAFVLASLPGVCRHSHAIANLPIDWRSRLLWWAGDLFSRFALCILLLETLAFLGKIGLPPFVSIGIVTRESWALLAITPSIPFILTAAAVLPLVGANVLAAALWAHLPSELRNRATFQLVLLPRRTHPPNDETSRSVPKD